MKAREWPFGSVDWRTASEPTLTIAGADFSRYAADPIVQRELKRYLLLRQMSGRRITMESKPIDEAWHAFILDTRVYRQFCDLVFGGYLDHVSDHFEPDRDLPALYERTFGEKMPEVWARTAASPFVTSDLFDGNCA